MGMTQEDAMADGRRLREKLDDGWRFFKGNAPGAHELSFNDSAWRKLDLPHDWSIEGPFSQKDPGGAGGGYLPGGIGWYRKTFALPTSCRGRRVIVEFDGVYMNASVWINGHKLGRHPYGYTSFCFDLTPYLRFGQAKNVLAVRVDDSKRPNTRWYSGAGIYRHVWLTITDKVHVAHWGVAVSTVQATRASATIAVETVVENETASPADVGLVTRLVGPDGQTAGAVVSTRTIRAGGVAKFVQPLVVKRPHLWDVDSPALYQALTRATVGGEARDDLVTPFGIRTARFDPDRGFILNGRKLKLKGVDVHHDNGCLGAAAHDRAEERRVELMKSIGANAIRTSHNPPSPAFLDACDRLGLVVMDEAFDEWEEGKLKYGYKDYFKDWWRDDIRSMVMRDRNHPSVVLWSIGNEVPEQGKPSGARTAAKMARFIRKLDPTRPVGYGAHPGHWTPELWEALDVAGYNYRDDLYATDHKAYPKRCILGSETFPLCAFRTWTAATDNKHIIGEFIWTGMDYLGESGIGYARDAHSKYPANTACCGEMDTCGFKKPRSFYRDILWNHGTRLHIVVHEKPESGEPFKLSPWGWPAVKSSWTWPAGKQEWWMKYGSEEYRVDVYSACEEVELRINGRTIGRSTTSRASRYMATWTVAFEPGVLDAIGYIAGKPVARHALRTAGQPAKLRLTPDRPSIRADGCDLSFVTVEVLDAKGVLHPNAANEISFAVRGPGRIIGIGNGDPASEESFQAGKRKAYNGRCLVVVQSTRRGGKINLTAASAGLASAKAAIVTA
jgi:beta-galactosidase